MHTNRARFNDGVTEFTLTTMEKCFPIGGVDDPNIVLLDNEATRSVFRNAALLGELGPCAPVTFGGINASEDSTIQARQKGILPGFGPVLYSEEAAVNALSWSSLVDAGLQLGYNADEDYFFVTDVHGDTHKFRRFGNLYGKIFDTHKAYATVENNRKLYTQRQLHGADRARDLERKMGFLPIGGISPSIINCPVTLHDIQRASEIYGRSIPSIKGKDRRAHQHTDVQERLDMDIDTELTLHVDLMYIESIPFFVSVSVPLGLTLLTHLGFAIGSRAKKPILAALDSQIKGYKSQRFSVIGIVSDGEGAITSLQSEINAMGVHVNINAPGQHVSIVERKIQTIKGCTRSIISSLPYKLPYSLVPHCVSFAVNRINMLPNKTGYVGFSPRELFFKRKTNYDTDIRTGFGDYAQVHNPNIISNSMHARTEGAIALTPTGNTHGSILFYMLSSGKITSRQQFVILPTPTEVVEHMNSLAASEKALIKEDTEISRGAY